MRALVTHGRWRTLGVFSELGVLFKRLVQKAGGGGKGGGCHVGWRNAHLLLPSIVGMPGVALLVHVDLANCDHYVITLLGVALPQSNTML
jgi:hypothetical protein